jgi:hypothetical protein
MSNQADLFAPPEPMRPSPKLNAPEIFICPRCGNAIIGAQRLEDGRVSREYRGRDGLCFRCDKGRNGAPRWSVHHA